MVFPELLGSTPPKAHLIQVGDVARTEECLAPCLAYLPQKRRMIHNTMLKAPKIFFGTWGLEDKIHTAPSCFLF